MGLLLADALVGPQGGGDRQVAGELRQEPRMEQGILWDVTEADPASRTGGPTGASGSLV